MGYSTATLRKLPKACESPVTRSRVQPWAERALLEPLPEAGDRRYGGITFRRRRRRLPSVWARRGASQGSVSGPPTFSAPCLTLVAHTASWAERVETLARRNSRTSAGGLDNVGRWVPTVCEPCRHCPALKSHHMPVYVGRRALATTSTFPGPWGWPKPHVVCMARVLPRALSASTRAPRARGRFGSSESPQALF